MERTRIRILLWPPFPDFASLGLAARRVAWDGAASGGTSRFQRLIFATVQVQRSTVYVHRWLAIAMLPKAGHMLPAISSPSAPSVR